MLDFEWDAEKAESNRKKHGVSFAEAMTAFRDPLERLLDDPGHSRAEERSCSSAARKRAGCLR
jgi:uncharacterized protein